MNQRVRAAPKCSSVAIPQRQSAMPDALKSTISHFEGIGADELILGPCIADLDQVDRAIAAVVG